MLENLGPEWIAFQQCIIDADQMLKKNKERFKSGLLSQAEEFRKKVNGLAFEFSERSPSTSQFTVESAQEVIAEFKSV